MQMSKPNLPQRSGAQSVSSVTCYPAPSTLFANINDQIKLSRARNQKWLAMKGNGSLLTSSDDEFSPGFCQASATGVNFGIS